MPDPVATNPNDKLPAGEGLKPGEIVPEEFENEELYRGSDPAPSDAGEPADPEASADRENQAGSERMDGDKLRRD